MAIISNGTTIADAGAFSVSLGSMVLIKTITVSSNTATVTFLHGSSSVVFNNTYPIYLVKIINSHNDTDDKTLRYNFTTDGTNYNTTVTNSYFRAFHDEGDTSTGFAYAANFDQAQGTSIINLDSGSGSGNHEASSGTLTIFDPANTTFAKHFMGQVSDENDGDFNHNVFTTGYFNTTSALTGIRFQLDSGNFDQGTIKMYGIK